MTKQVLLILLCIAALFVSCTMNLAGTGTETSTKITGVIVDTLSNPVPGAEVKLIPVNYNPVTDGGITKSFIDTTNISGEYSFKQINPGAYNIQGTHLSVGTRVLIYGIVVTKDTVTVPDGVLKYPGLIKVFLPDTMDTVNGYIFIQGTTIHQNLSEVIPDSSGLLIILDSVPEAVIPAIHYGKAGDPAQPAPISDTIAVLSGKKSAAEAFVYWAHYTTANSGLTANRLDQVFIASDGALWFHPTGAGVVSFNGNAWTQYNTVNSGLPSDTVTNMAQAKNSTFWFTTARGITKFDGSAWITYTSADSDLPYDWVTDVALDSKGDIWFGMTGFIAKFDGSQWTIFDTASSSALINTLQYLTIDNNDDVWVATNNGVLKYDNSSWTLYNTANSNIFNDQALIIAVDNDNNKWFSHNNGVSKFDGSAWTVYTSANSGIITGQVYHTYQDNEDNLWICSAAGLTRFDGVRWRDYTGEKYPLLENIRIHDIAIDNKGNTWVGTFDKGVVVFGPTKK